MKSYHVIVNWDSLRQFENLVTDHLAAGWQLQGGAIFLLDARDSSYGWAQTLVSEEFRNDSPP